LKYSKDTRWLAKWWNERSVPISQGRVSQMLREKGLISPNSYLFKNLGLSLDDYYWIRPADSNLRWEDVNLFDNDFKENILMSWESKVQYFNFFKIHLQSPLYSTICSIK